MLDKSPPGQDETESRAPSAAPAGTSLAVLIVGMHRSGTSALSGVLNLLGVAVPESQHPADEHNQRGYFEPQRIIDFHEALFATLGSPSNDPLALDYGWVRSPVGEAAVERLADLLDEEFADNAMCLFKDPRICRLMPVWSAALERSGRAGVAILPYRRPLEVAGSLANKAGLSRPYSLFMWLQHVLLGERFTRELPRSFADYDLLMLDWRAVVGKLQSDLGLVWPRDVMRAGVDIDGFLSGELRHHRDASGALSPHDALEALCARAWAALGRLRDAPYDAQAMADMDAVWGDLVAGQPVFGPLVVSYQRSERALQDQVRGLHGDLARQHADFGREVERRDQIISMQTGVLHEQQAALIARSAEEQAAARKHKRQLREALRHAAGVEQTLRQTLHETLHGTLQKSNDELAHARARLHALETSSFWALSFPLRRLLTRFPVVRKVGRGAIKLTWWTLTLKLGRKLRERREFFAAQAARPYLPVIEPAPQPHVPPPALPPAQRAISGEVLFVSGEADTPGHRYRVVRWAEAARRAGAEVTVVRAEEVWNHLDAVRRADMLFVWRTPWDPNIAAMLEAAGDAGVPVVFDTDDLMFDPELATVKTIDGIRSQGLDEEEVADFYRRVQGVLAAADFCTAPTPLLAHRMRRFDKPSFVLPNGFDEEVLQRSRLAARRWRAQPADGLVRIGYATGSRTHQRDFAQCAEAVAQVLRAHPNARLVLFKDSFAPVMDIGEFPEFEGLEGQIEWRDMVPIERLPDELARFDISIAPLEVGNPFCEAKSELKYFEAALVDVPTVASPTEPFRLAIQPGRSGLLAANPEQWRSALTRLIEDPALRASMARSALWDSLADYGPERATETFLSMMEQVLASPRRVGRAFELALLRQARPRRAPPHVPPHEIVFARDQLRSAQATVVIPLYNYARFIEEALDSVSLQTVADLDLIVVDDASTDDSQAVARAWIERNASRFNRVLLIRNTPNAGLGFSRNVGFANAETPYVLPLDADNRLLPHCVQQALASIEQSSAAFAYPRIRQFGDSDFEMGAQSWNPGRLVLGNYIDAMALIRRSAWAQVGGYDHVRHGWEDYDFWCRLVEQGMFGVQMPEVLAEYRVHGASMLRSETDLHRNKIRLVDDMERRHPWLRIERPAAPVEDRAAAPAAPDDQAARLDRILPLLRCPVSGQPLAREGEALRAVGTDKVWPLVRGRPVLIEGLDEPRTHPDEMISNCLPEQAIRMIGEADGFVLNLSGGGTDRRFDNVVEAEFSIFRHTDVVADAHRLPFADAVFELVISMNAFEHYGAPDKAAAEIMRVLKPGGRVFVHTAFMQPLHEAPWHFYNCTRYGLERWFEQFETESLRVSENFNPIFPLTWQLSDAEAALRRELTGEDAERLLDSTARDLVSLWRNPETRNGELWRSFFALPQAAQEGLAGGFEYLGRKPG